MHAHACQVGAMQLDKLHSCAEGPLHVLRVGGKGSGMPEWMRLSSTYCVQVLQVFMSLST